MSECCNDKEKPSRSADEITRSSCCPNADADISATGRKSGDWLLIITATAVALTCIAQLITHWWFPDRHFEFTAAVYELMSRMWWGLVLAAVFVGLLEHTPQELIVGILGSGSQGGRGNSLNGILRATCAGVLLDLCSHGILMVGMKLYQRGVSYGQVLAFLIASPWNSLSLTVVLISLIGIGWTLMFIALSLVVGVVAGLIGNSMVAAGRLPANPNTVNLPSDYSVRRALLELWRSYRWSAAGFMTLLTSGIKGSGMVLRWVFLGVLMAAAIRAFVPLEMFQTWFGPTLAGLGMTLVAATIIEVCSEGSTPIAADLLIRANAPGNSFTFLMTGIATDYTEVMSIKDTTGTWKLALFLPLATIPQILLIGWLLNQVTL